MKRTDLMLGLYILVPIIFLIIPIPLFLLDILMMLNLAIALFILFNALFSTEALNMSSFPDIAADDNVVSYFIECRIDEKYSAERRGR